MNFDELGLGPEILRAISDVGYEQPTPIQEQAIPHVLMGRDVLGCAQTGTGKTASFTLPMIEILSSGRARARMPRSLILTPTRELATQIAENFELYGKYHKLTMALLIGGVSADAQVRKLDRGVDVLIATPGRLLDHFGQGRILLTDIKVLVIDEADRMLDMGFIPDVERIVSLLPAIRQTLFFSATMPPEIRRLADKFLMNPKEISVASKSQPAAETVTQSLTIVEDRDKRDTLRRIINGEDVRNALIFCNRKRDVNILYKSLQKHGFSVAALHGDMDQASRTETLEAFKNNEMKLLVCSDVAARGLDIDDLSHVFNFDVPMHAEDYIHRIGRTGRAGKEGRAFTLATPDDTKFVSAITKLIGKEIPRFDVEGVEQAELDESGGRRTRRRRGGKEKTAAPAEKSRGSARPAPEAREPARRRPASKEAAEPSTEQPSTEQPAAEQSAAEQPRPENPRTTEQPRTEQNRAENTRNDRSRRSRGRDNDRDEPVVGMGSHVPAFMLRPARPARAKENSDA